MLNRKLHSLQLKIIDAKSVISDEINVKYKNCINGEQLKHEELLNDLSIMSSSIEGFLNSLTCPECDAKWENNRCTGGCNRE